MRRKYIWGLGLLLVFILFGCAESEPAAPGLTYAELLSNAKLETGSELSRVINTDGVSNSGWTIADGRIWLYGVYRTDDGVNFTDVPRFANCDVKGGDILSIELPEVEPAESTLELLAEGQQARAGIENVLMDQAGTLYVLQEDEIYHEEPYMENGKPLVVDGVPIMQQIVERTVLHLRGFDGKGKLTTPVTLALPLEQELHLSNRFFDADGNLWVTAYGDLASTPFFSALWCFSVQDGTLLKSVSLPENTLTSHDGTVCLSDDRVVISGGDMTPGMLGVPTYYVIEDITAATPSYRTLIHPDDYWSGIVDRFVMQDRRRADTVMEWTADGVWRWDIDTGDCERLYSWEEYSIRSGDIAAVFALPEEELLVITQEELYGEYKFLRLSPMNGAALQNAITVAVSGSMVEQVAAAANVFNFAAPERFVRVLDYSDAAAAAKGFSSGSEMLNNDILSGSVPDIVLTSAENITAHIRKGLFADLYPFIDADTELSRADFVAGTLVAPEQDGTLPTVLLSYNLLTAVGDPDVVGSTPGWTWEEFYSVLAANPQAKTPYYLYNRYYVLLYQLMLGGSSYLDYATGTAHLDSPEFVRILESSAAYPAENGDYTADPKPVFAARQSLLNIQFIGDFRSVIAQNYAFDGPVVYKGFPSDAGGGSAFTSVLRGGITSYCTDPDAAWRFLRTLLLPEFQDNIQHSLPVRRDSLQKLAQAAAEPGQMAGLPPYLAGVTLTDSQKEYWQRGITAEESAALLALIENTDVLYQYDSTIASILWEEADYFYNGVRTAEEAAALIQNRVQTYLAEQG